MPTALKLKSNSAGNHQQLQHYELDFVLMSASYYVRVHENNVLARAVATLVESNQGEPVPAFGGVIFCLRERSDINSLEDLKSQKIAIVNQMSFGGYQMQALELLQQGIHLPADAKTIETGLPQDKAIAALMSGTADAAFVRTGLIEAMHREHKLDMQQLLVINPLAEPGFTLSLSTLIYTDWPLAAMPWAPPVMTATRAWRSIWFMLMRGPGLARRWGGWRGRRCTAG